MCLGKSEQGKRVRVREVCVCGGGIVWGLVVREKTLAFTLSEMKP